MMEPITALPSGLRLFNGGQECDLLSGPCACGATHNPQELPQRIFRSRVEMYLQRFRAISIPCDPPKEDYEALEKLLAETRRDALEEAARACEDLDARASYWQDCARVIRNLP